MAGSKLTAFTAAQQDVARWAKALGHPARVAILETLARRGACICGEIVDELPLAQATVSQHLKALKEAGLVEGTIDGPRSCYCINKEAYARMAEYLRQWIYEQGCACGCC
ncbi:MAG: winged helix-turn-helix transcriptional regulator [Rhodothermales bacterium]|nr:winged helix-turn-helix transcriptional regulator [Rhodothermales bacterium]MBO6780294.1 winged helix-turn-helix transcriptional regulator [Rhodothermales bacterium]